jgi:hypothetical protein
MLTKGKKVFKILFSLEGEMLDEIKYIGHEHKILLVSSEKEGFIGIKDPKSNMGIMEKRIDNAHQTKDFLK